MVTPTTGRWRQRRRALIVDVAPLPLPAGLEHERAAAPTRPAAPSAPGPAGPPPATCAGPPAETISGFSRYQNSVASLPPAEQAKLARVAAAIRAARARGCPVVEVELTGHADRDPQRTPDFHLQISRGRADAVKQALARAIGEPLASQIAWKLEAAGASRPAVPDARTEAQRMRNRRVEIAARSRQPLPITLDELRAVARKIQLALSDAELRRLQAGGTVSTRQRPLAEFCNTLMMARLRYPDGSWPAAPAPVSAEDWPRPSSCPRSACSGLCFVVARKQRQDRTYVVCFCIGLFFVRLCGAFLTP